MTLPSTDSVYFILLEINVYTNKRHNKLTAQEVGYWRSLSNYSKQSSQQTVFVSHFIESIHRGDTTLIR